MLSTQTDPLPPFCYTLYKYIPLYLFTRGGGGEGGIGDGEKARGSFTREVKNTNMTDCISGL